MEIIDKNIDGGKSFDWGRTSSDYAKYRDIYPHEFYKKIIDRNLCIKGQNILDLGTGTGIIPLLLYGRNNTVTKFTKKPDAPKLKVDRTEPEDRVYGGLFEKYKPTG